MYKTDDLDDGGRATGIDLNELLRTYQDDPNNELRTYTDSLYMRTESVFTFLNTEEQAVYCTEFKYPEHK